MQIHYTFAVLTLSAATSVYSAESESSGSLQVESRVFLSSPMLPEQFSAHSQTSLVVTPEWRHRTEGNQFTFVPFVRLDSRDKERTHADIREAYWNFDYQSMEILVGVNRVFWGTAESRHLVDIVNQNDNLEDLDGEDKLGQPMVNVSMQRDWGNLDMFMLLGFRERSFPGLEGRLRPFLVVDSDLADYESSAGKRHVDFAARYSHSLKNWDIGLSYFKGTSREPRLLVDNNTDFFRPYYDQISQIGIDLQYTSDAWLWKLEGIQRHGQGRTFGAVVAGFEYTLFQIANGNSDLGLLAEFNYDGRDINGLIAPPTLFNKDFFLAARWTWNDVQNSSILAGIITDIETNESMLSIESKRRIGNSWTAEIEGRFFINTYEEGIAGSFQEDSAIALQLTYFY